MQVPSERELERFFDAETAGDVQFLETLGSWPSLRILDHLFRIEHATTGEIARELNMDMREVKDRLDGLAKQGIVEGEEGEWRVATDQVSVTVERSDGIEITHSLDKRTPVSSTDASSTSSTEATAGANGAVSATTEGADTGGESVESAIEGDDSSPPGQTSEPPAQSADSDDDRSKGLLTRLRELFMKPF